ncbi:MAG: hypothetical protein AAF458_03645 [Pseudomonadota bacterium]
MASTQPTPETSPASRAALHNPQNFFGLKLSAVPRHQFAAECRHAFANDTPTSEILLDISADLGTPYPATTPLLLARYLRIRPDEEMVVNRWTSGEVLYVLRGSGSSSGAGEHFDWDKGDAFAFPGGVDVTHRATSDTVLFTVCNEPLLRYERLRPPAPGEAIVRPVLWPFDTIERSLDEVYARDNGAEASGRAVQLSSEDMAPAVHTFPSMNVAINTLEAGGDQRPHRHNGVAITLAVHGDGVHSMIEDQQIDWMEGAAQVTPATELHSHHNRGDGRMYSLVVQDEGLHFYTRTPGFSWT